MDIYSNLTSTRTATIIPTISPAPSLPASHSSNAHQTLFGFIAVLLSKFGVALDITKLGSLLIAGSLAWNWWNIVRRFISNWVNRLFWCTLEVDNTSGDDCYDQLMSWLAAQPFANNTSVLKVTQTREKLELEPWGFYRRIGLSEEEKNLEFTPATGQHRFWYKGHWIFYTRMATKKGIHKDGEIIILSTVARSPAILKEIFFEARQTWMARDVAKTIVYREHTAYDDWKRTGARNPRPLGSIVLDEDQKVRFISDITDYLSPSTMRWYQSRGIPYRRGYLLHGPPGTGKSSLTFAIAGSFGLPVYILSLSSSRLSEDRLGSLFAALPTKCILLLEDIDAAFIKRDEEENDGDSKDGGKNKAKKARSPPANISFSALLNAIDGVASSEGRILIMTTNHIENLDPALIRAGRADLHIEFSLASHAVSAELFRRMFDSYENDLEPVLVPVTDPDTGIIKYVLQKPKIKSEDFTAEDLEIMSEEFANAVPEGQFSPAEIQGFLLRFKRCPRKALAQVEVWVQEVFAEREKNKKKEELQGEADRKKNEKDGKKAEPRVAPYAVTGGINKEEVLAAIKDGLAEVVKELIEGRFKDKEDEKLLPSGGAATGAEGQLVKSLLEVES